MNCYNNNLDTVVNFHIVTEKNNTQTLIMVTEDDKSEIAFNVFEVSRVIRLRHDDKQDCMSRIVNDKHPYLKREYFKHVVKMKGIHYFVEVTLSKRFITDNCRVRYSYTDDTVPRCSSYVNPFLAMGGVTLLNNDKKKDVTGLRSSVGYNFFISSKYREETGRIDRLEKGA